MTDTLEDLLATSLRGAADTLDATPDVDAALTTGRRKLRHRRIAVGASVAVTALLVSAATVWAWPAGNTRVGVPLTTASATALPSSEHTVELAGGYLPDPAEAFHAPPRDTDAQSITLHWSPTTGQNGTVRGEYVRKDGTTIAFQGDCQVPCFIAGPDETGYGVVIVPTSESAGTHLLGESPNTDQYSSSGFWKSIPDTKVKVYLTRYFDLDEPSKINGVFYLTEKAAYGPGNVEIPSHLFPDREGTLVFASRTLDIFGAATRNPLSRHSLKANPRGIVDAGPDLVPGSSVELMNAHGIIPATATDVSFSAGKGAKNVRFDLNDTEDIAGGHVFFATWEGPAGDYKQIAVSYTDEKGKRVRVGVS